MNDLIRTKILAFLQWNDKNGYYTDERCDLEEVQKLSLEESIKYFFGVIGWKPRYVQKPVTSWLNFTNSLYRVFHKVYFLK